MMPRWTNLKQDCIKGFSTGTRLKHMTDEWEAKLADPHSHVVFILYSLQTLIIHKHIAFSSTPWFFLLFFPRS